MPSWVREHLSLSPLLGLCLSVLLLVPAASHGADAMKVLLKAEGFVSGDGGAPPEGWSAWSPRAEIAPSLGVDPKGGRSGRGALTLKGGGNPSAHGAWRREVKGVQPGRSYRFSAWFRTHDIPSPQQHVGMEMDWLDASGERARPPDFALAARREGAWSLMEYETTAPEGAASVRLGLSLSWAPKGTLWWDGVEVAEAPAREGRVVRAVTVYTRPKGSGSAEESVRQFCALLDGATTLKPDIVCLPEGITVVGTSKSYAEVSEPLKGPTARSLGEVARKLNAYIVAGIYERDGGTVYNTAILIDRQGRLAGSYRKTHLPREEVEGGITPGSGYPVFKTDFGTVGLLICWDLQFPEPWRALALKGAEVVLLPIWGGTEVLAHARAIENHLFIVTSSYDMRSFILDPVGSILCEATEKQPLAVAELRLDRKILQPWLGDMKTRTWRERRPDLATP
ncbi:MAG TPA: carbon-nitrogen hydrolase family protein [Armatimonadota bacterium]|jgi:predicted amidohydrolase